MSGISSPPVPLKFDSAGNVLANINAQNINPTIANPYTPQLLSHQTGLSITVSTANMWTNIGSSITVPRAGIVKITIIEHVSGGTSVWILNITRGSTTYTINDENGYGFNSASNTSPRFLSRYRYSNYGLTFTVLELPVLANDVLQLQTENTTAGNTNYLDDFVVVLQ